MTTKITKNNLRKSAASVCLELLESVNEMQAPEHDFSENSEIIMRYVSTGTSKGRRGASRLILRKAVAAVLVLLVGTGSMLAFNEDARAAVYSWIRIIRENEKRVDYLYYFEDIGVLNTEIMLDYVPDDFVEKKVSKSDTFIVLLFEHTRYNNGFVISLMDLSSVDIFCLHDYQDNLEEVMINGIKGDFYLSSKEFDTNTLIWTIKEKNIAVSINSNLSKDEIIKIAEGIIFIN